METDRRKGLRRERDKELDTKMLALETALQSHLTECSDNAKAMRNELASMNQRFDTYHAQNQAVSQEAKEMLNVLVNAKRVTVWTARAVRWIAGLLAAVAGATGLLAYFKTH